MNMYEAWTLVSITRKRDSIHTCPVPTFPDFNLPPEASGTTLTATACPRGPCSAPNAGAAAHFNSGCAVQSADSPKKTTNSWYVISDSYRSPSYDRGRDVHTNSLIVCAFSTDISLRDISAHRRKAFTWDLQCIMHESQHWLRINSTE
jgi:hypothetical protein